MTRDVSLLHKTENIQYSGGSYNKHKRAPDLQLGTLRKTRLVLYNQHIALKACACAHFTYLFSALRSSSSIYSPLTNV